jgi:hypothetical protein
MVTMAVNRVRKRLGLPESAALRIYNPDFNLKQASEVRPVRQIGSIFRPGNFGVLVFQRNCPDFEIPPPKTRLPGNPKLRYYLQESDENWNDFRDFLRTNMRRIEITLTPVLPGSATVVILPENVTLLAAVEFLARTQQLEVDDHDRPGVFRDSQNRSIDISGSKTLQSLQLPLKAAFSVSMVPIGGSE